jgi:hypothetical protein
MDRMKRIKKIKIKRIKLKRIKLKRFFLLLSSISYPSVLITTSAGEHAGLKS